MFLSDLDHLVRHEKSKSSSRDFSNVSSYTENSNTGTVAVKALDTLLLRYLDIFNPTNAEATLVQSTRMQSFLKTI